MKKYILSLLLLLSSFNMMAQEKGLDQRIDEAFQPISDFFSKYVFYPIGDYPFVIYLLVGSALFFTLYFGFPNLKYFGLLLMSSEVSMMILKKVIQTQKMVKFPIFKH